MIVLPMHSVVSCMHMESPSNFYIKLYDNHNYFNVPAIYSNPEIFLMLLRARESRVMYLSGGKLTILSIEFDEIDNFSTRPRVLSTLVYNLSMGGFLIDVFVPGRPV